MSGADRPVQMGLLDVADDRPVGRLVGSVMGGVNADVIAAVAPLYLTGSVLDVTYGRGMWWKRFTPDPFGFHDLALDGVDFRQLPHADRSWSAVCFDPPYVPRHGESEPKFERDVQFRARYGLDVSRTELELWELINAGLAEVARVADRWVLVKCCDYTNGRRFHLGHVRVVAEAERLGLVPWDLVIHVTGPGPGGSRIRVPRRTRRGHSYLLVFRRP